MTRGFVSDLYHKELSYQLVGVLFEAHNKLGRYAREHQYGDFIQRRLQEEKILFQREMHITKTGKDKNYIDFLVQDVIILELKAKPLISREDYYQVLRYLEFAKLKLAYLVNFRQQYLHPKRIINNQLIVSD